MIRFAIGFRQIKKIRVDAYAATLVIRAGFKPATF